ncbi:sugar phosphate isomerase/epimerase family protein [Fundicoccus sp. Sow4_H7]|uniref:sugar phosphate isomerase/epimerase family protein n=1 Tax=Fundicoccus sp. Sow4_H7 TaxID=3438784 RepID=UPI003F8E9727
MYNIGVRAHDIANTTLEDLAAKLKERNINYIQLALKRSLKEHDVTTRNMNVGMAKDIGNIFSKQDVNIAVLGCYVNLIHPDPVERKAALDFFKAHIRHAKHMGALTVGTETGAATPEVQYTEKNFEEVAFISAVHSVKELVAEAEKHGVIVAIEGGINHPIYSPKMMKRLLDEVDSNNMQVILDVVNYIFPDNASVETQHQIIDEAFDLFGDRITVIHAKDFVIENNEKKIVPVGQGEMDYEYLLNKVKAEKPRIPVLLEETEEPYIESSTEFLKKYNK